MMNETVQHECLPDEMPDFEVMKQFMEDDSNAKICEQITTKIREIHAPEDKPGQQLRKRSAQRPLSLRCSRLMNLDETYRAPSLFTWRC